MSTGGGLAIARQRRRSRREDTQDAAEQCRRIHGASSVATPSASSSLPWLRGRGEGARLVGDSAPGLGGIDKSLVSRRRQATSLRTIGALVRIVSFLVSDVRARHQLEG